jgi:molybdopterin-guanine dinucleotide biosynthesis protein A
MGPLTCTGAILAGGEASRFGGGPKGLERVGGVRIIDRVALALAQATDGLLLIANDPGAGAWLPGVRTVADIHAGRGSLGGIHAALVHAGAAVLVVAWDMPFVPTYLLRDLRRLGESGHDAAIAESGSKRGVEPLCAWYAPSCVPAIERALAAGRGEVISFFGDVRVARMAAGEVAAHGDPARMFMNVNSPDELELAERYASTPDAGDRRPQTPR